MDDDDADDDHAKGKRWTAKVEASNSESELRSCVTHNACRSLQAAPGSAAPKLVVDVNFAEFTRKLARHLLPVLFASLASQLLSVRLLAFSGRSWWRNRTADASGSHVGPQLIAAPN